MFESLMTKGAVKIKVEMEKLGPLGATDICFERSRYTFLKANGDVLTDGRYETFFFYSKNDLVSIYYSLVC